MIYCWDIDLYIFYIVHMIHCWDILGIWIFISFLYVSVKRSPAPVCRWNEEQPDYHRASQSAQPSTWTWHITRVVFMVMQLWLFGLISRLIPDLGQVTENRVDFSGTMVWPNLKMMMMMAMVIEWKRGMIEFFQTHLKAATANSFVTAGVVRLEYWRKRTITNFSWRTGWFLVYWLEVDDPLTYIVSTKKTLPTCIFKYK